MDGCTVIINTDGHEVVFDVYKFLDVDAELETRQQEI
jgi:hypothetical protein